MQQAVKLIFPNSPVNYRAFLALQERFVQHKLKNYDNQQRARSDYLLLMEHDRSTVTGGRRSKGFTLSDGPRLKVLGADSYETGRGGLITWHGPGQLCLYPILDLRQHTQNMHWYIERLENILIRACADHCVEAYRGNDRCSEVGVWTGTTQKIGFVGIRNSKWITSFGVSLNVSNNLKWFDEILPCGLEGVQVTNMQAESQKVIHLDAVKQSLLNAFKKEFNVELELASHNLMET